MSATLRPHFTLNIKVPLMKPSLSLSTLKFTFLSVVILALLTTGCAATPLSRPNGVVPAPDGTLYVMDFGNYRIAHLDMDGKLIDSFGSFGDEPEQIFYGWDLALDSEGNIYFGNIIQGTGRISQDGIKVFTNQGSLLREIGVMNYDLTSQDKSNTPYGIDIDRKGHLYVTDYSPATLRIFGRQGELLGTFLGKGDPNLILHNINDVAVDDGRMLLYVSDFIGNQIYQFEISFDENDHPTLTYTWSRGGYGREPGKFSFPQNLAVDDRNGYLYIGDLGNRRIQVLTSSGNLLGSFRAPDNVKDWQIMGMNVDEAGNLYVADALNNCIWVFAPNPQTGGEASLFLKRIEVKP